MNKYRITWNDGEIQYYEDNAQPWYLFKIFEDWASKGLDHPVVIERL